MKVTLDGLQGSETWASHKEAEDQRDWGFLGPVNHTQLVSVCSLSPSLVSRVTSSSQPQAQEGRAGN